MYQFAENEFLNLFDDPKKAQVNLGHIRENVPDTHTVFLQRLHYELKQNPSPDEVLNCFEQLTRSVINKVSFYKMLCDFPPIIARLVRIFTSSRFLSDLIIKDFEYTYFLIRPDLDCKSFDIQQLRKSVKSILYNTTYSINRKMDQLRILKRRELLKIGIRDYILDDPLDVTTRAVSTLADELVQAVLTMTNQAFVEKYNPPSTVFSVIALGKLGGGELNYSSDIDLMFVYSEEGTIAYHGHEITHHEFFNQICRAVISGMTYSSPEGQLYRVDTRLRPDGDSGPLARCVSGFIHYYESRGQLWERQMLIKARCIAGDMEFGQHFLEQLRPFIYPITFFESPLKEIAQMKWRIEEQKSTDKLNIKICPGGIRDIEFVVQALQLINGGRIPGIQTGNTLSGLTKLFENNLLSENEYRILTDSYIFYRKIEHILQIAEDRQTHSLSGETKQVSKISFLLNFNSTETFLRQLDTCLEKIRLIYNTVFEASKIIVNQDNMIQLFCTDTLNTELQDRLMQSGFESPYNAHRILRLLNFGQFPKLYSIKTQELFAQLLPNLLAIVKKTPNPDQTIMNFERLVAGYPFTDMIYNTFLNQQQFLDLVVHICTYSNTFVNVLCKSPSYVDYLISHYQDWINSDDYLPHIEFSNYRNFHVFKNMEFLKLAIQYHYGKKRDDQLYKNLSELADFLLKKVFQKYFSDSDAVSLVGLGKLGGRELSYKSDLDIVFVCKDKADVDDLIAKSKIFLNEITAMTSHGRLYEIDARLRPEGKQAPLVVTVSRYSDYLENRAMFWERQALVKSRFICGDISVEEKVFRLFEKIVYEKGLGTDEIHAIAAMRQRQTKEKVKDISTVIHDFKFSRGGILDIEYVIQAFQMKFGRENTSLRTGNTLQAIHALGELSLITKEEFQILSENYLFLRNLEVYDYLAFERKSNKLPQDEKQLAFLSKFLKFNKDNRLLEYLSQIKKQNEVLFSKLMQELEYGK